jgi:ADP-heptose:LPS heptosyltransferase
MDLRENTEVRMSEYRSTLGLINRSIADEMSKRYDQRQMSLLLFLHVEKAAHSLALVELEALLQGSDKRGEDTISALRRERVIDSMGAAEDGNEETRVAGSVCRILTWGGLGDALLITPAIRVIKKLHPDCRIHVYCDSKHHKEVLMNNKHIDRLLTLGPVARVIFHLLVHLKFISIKHVNYARLGPSVFYQRNATNIIGEMLGVEIDDPRPECFLTEEEEKEADRALAEYNNPIVIHATAGSSPNKNWTAENWESLVLKNPQYTFLQIGSEDDEPIQGAINLCGKTSIRQAFGIVKKAKAFVGVDSIFAHAAAAFRQPAVILFGASTPLVWGHAGSINLYNPPHCSPCIELLARDPCPYGRKCMTNIAVSDVEYALSSLIAQPAERA